MACRLILASASPRRRDLLQQLGVEFSVQAADIDESRRRDETVEDYVCRLAREKAAAIAATVSEDEDVCILAADTTVALGEETLGKPVDSADARSMLERLSGVSHRVCSAVCALRGAETFECCVTTDVEFCELRPADIEAYLGSDEPWDKAGGYAIQGLAGRFVRGIVGSYSNVVGLPLVETRELLEAAGVQTGITAETGP